MTVLSKPWTHTSGIVFVFTALATSPQLCPHLQVNHIRFGSATRTDPGSDRDGSICEQSGWQSTANKAFHTDAVCELFANRCRGARNVSVGRGCVPSERTDTGCMLLVGPAGPGPRASFLGLYDVIGRSRQIICRWHLVLFWHCPCCPQRPFSCRAVTIWVSITYIRYFPNKRRQRLAKPYWHNRSIRYCEREISSALCGK